jgi:RNA polymerase-interacting CarD/CdnL/TRCF family regulator
MDEHRKTKPAGKDDHPARIPFPTAPRRTHKIHELPDDLKNELDRRLAEGTFRSHYVLSEWLGRNGYQISHQAINQYGRKFDLRLEAIRLATEQARIVCAQFKDDDVDMQTALLRLVQTRLFEVLSAINEQKKTAKAKRSQKRGEDQCEDPGEEKIATVNITALARCVSGLARAESENRKWAEHAREAVAAASKKLEAAREKGLSPQAADQIRAVLMEI